MDEIKRHGQELFTRVAGSAHKYCSTAGLLKSAVARQRRQNKLSYTTSQLFLTSFSIPPENTGACFQNPFSERGCVPGASRSAGTGRKTFGLAEMLRLVFDPAALHPKFDNTPWKFSRAEPQPDIPKPINGRACQKTARAFAGPVADSGFANRVVESYF
jgi:hypothetical protein